MDLPRGTKLQDGKYKICRTLGNGSFGYTYLAEHCVIREKVAIKELFIQGVNDRARTRFGFESLVKWPTDPLSNLKSLEWKMSFLREVKTLWKLRQSHIVHVMDVFEENCTVYYVMEYINGSSLRSIIEATGGLDDKEAVSYIKQIAKGLRYMHKKNRLHLDIKPENIIIDKKGYVYIIDFGASVHLVDEHPTNDPHTFTANFASFEQITKGKLSPASDVYSVGATLYNMLSDRVPTDAYSRVTGTAHLESLSDIVSPELWKIVKKAMRKSPEHRYRTMDAFLKDLENLNI